MIEGGKSFSTFKDWPDGKRRVSASRLLEIFYYGAIFNRLPIAIWRHPDKVEKEAVVDLSGSTVTALDLTNLTPGFIFAPFEKPNADQIKLIKADVYLKGTNLNFRETLAHTPNQLRFESFIREFWDNHVTSEVPNQNLWYPNRKSNHHLSTKEQDFCNWVSEVLDEIDRNKLKKVVLSRTLQVRIREDFNPLILFNNLCNTYTNAFVSLVAIPEIGTWIGATPELLLSFNENELTTVALAGTQSVASNPHALLKNWGKKEIEEQEIVSTFIRDCFRKQNINNYAEHGPESVRIGNLLHLKTEFKLNHLPDSGKIVPEELLRCLHPTPAVCGVPKEAALEFIRNKETHKREYYSGYLGPVNFPYESQLFVNLRCLQLQENVAVLFAGGGITSDSNPEQEWLETELKIYALLRFLKKKPAAIDSMGQEEKNKVVYDDGI